MSLASGKAGARIPDRRSAIFWRGRCPRRPVGRCTSPAPRFFAFVTARSSRRLASTTESRHSPSSAFLRQPDPDGTAAIIDNSWLGEGSHSASLLQVHELGLESLLNAKRMI